MDASRQMLYLLRTRRRFRWLFTGVLVSRVGDYFNGVALEWLILTIAGPRTLGVFLFVNGVAGALSGPVAGMAIERYGLRAMVALDDFTRASLVATLPLLLWLGALPTWYLLVLAFVTGALSTLSELGQNVALPELVERDEITSATTLMSAIWDVSAWAGPVAAGLVVKYAGIPAALGFDAATFVYAGLAALTLPTARASGPASPHAGSPFSGFATAARIRPLVVAVGSLVSLLTLTGVLEVCYPVISRSALRIGPDGFGLLMSVGGAAGLVGTLLITPRLGRLRANLALGIPYCARLLALVPLALTTSYPVALAVVFGTSCLDGSLYAQSRAKIQQFVPASNRACVFGAVGMVTTAGFPLGSVAAGAALSALGTRAPLLLATAMLLPVALYITATHVFEAPREEDPNAAPLDVIGVG